jgi:hypothetical protein
MKRLSYALFAAALGFVLAGANQARASYLYDWDLAGGASTVTLNSDHNDYQLKLINEPSKGPLGNGTDTTATQMTMVPIHKGTMDTFHGAFDLSLVITDQANGLSNDGKGGDPKALVYHVTFTTTVYADGATSTSAVSLMPTTSQIVLGKDTFTVGIPTTGQWFVAPPTVGSVNTGSVGLHIDFKSGSGSGGNPTPEPSSMVLAGLGLAFSGFAAWRKRRVA